MRVFDKVEGWGSKVNFVDENNVVLGYDLSQDCCEWADWFISDSMLNDVGNDIDVNVGRDTDLTKYRFDTQFFMEHEGGLLDSGKMVVFRIFDGENEKFIHLFNCHNGYYSHGFDFVINNKVVREDYL